MHKNNHNCHIPAFSVGSMSTYFLLGFCRSYCARRLSSPAMLKSVQRIALCLHKALNVTYGHATGISTVQPICSHGLVVKQIALPAGNCTSVVRCKTGLSGFTVGNVFMQLRFLVNGASCCQKKCSLPLHHSQLKFSHSKDPSPKGPIPQGQMLCS